MAPRTSRTADWTASLESPFVAVRVRVVELWVVDSLAMFLPPASCGTDAAVIGLQLIEGLPRGVEEPPMARFKSTAAHAAAHGGKAMSDLKSTARDAGADMKEAWRKADGEESLGDKAANLGDRAENAVKNAGDEVHEKTDEASRDAAYERGRADEASR
jgi:hypothetical protein